jgi:hypothetical protein
LAVVLFVGLDFLPVTAAEESVDGMQFAPDRDGAARGFPSIEKVLKVRVRNSYDEEASARFGRQRSGAMVLKESSSCSKLPRRRHPGPKAAQVRNSMEMEPAALEKNTRKLRYCQSQVAVIRLLNGEAAGNGSSEGLRGKRSRGHGIILSTLVL